MKLRLRTSAFNDIARGNEFKGPGEFEIDDPVAEEYAKRAVWEVVDSSDDEIESAADDTDATDDAGAADTDGGWTPPPETAGTEDSDDTDSETPDALDAAIEETLEVGSDEDDESDTDDPLSVDLHAFLEANVGPITDQIESGRFDADLDMMKNIEKSTKERKTIIRAIEERQNNG